MPKIICDECRFDGCRDSCLAKHKDEFACHNKLCTNHLGRVSLRSGRLYAKTKPEKGKDSRPSTSSSSRRRESEDRPRHSSDRGRPSTERSRPSGLFPDLMDGLFRRKDKKTKPKESSYGGPSTSERIDRGTRYVWPEDDNGGPGPSTSENIDRGTRYVWADDDDNDDDDEGPWYPSYGGPRPRPSSRQRSPSSRPSTSYQPSGNASGSTSYYDAPPEKEYRPGGNSRSPSPPLETNWGVE